VPITVEQCRAARALLDWSIGDLATAASLGVMTVNRFEAGQAVRSSSVDGIEAALAQAGVVFIRENETSRDGGIGVRLATPPPPPRKASS
jgi:hypothetical protein